MLDCITGDATNQLVEQQIRNADLAETAHEKEGLRATTKKAID